MVVKVDSGHVQLDIFKVTRLVVDAHLWGLRSKRANLPGSETGHHQRGD